MFGDFGFSSSGRIYHIILLLVIRINASFVYNGPGGFSIPVPAQRPCTHSLVTNSTMPPCSLHHLPIRGSIRPCVHPSIFLSILKKIQKRYIAFHISLTSSIQSVVSILPATIPILGINLYQSQGDPARMVGAFSHF